MPMPATMKQAGWEKKTATAPTSPSVSDRRRSPGRARIQAAVARTTMPARMSLVLLDLRRQKHKGRAEREHSSRKRTGPSVEQIVSQASKDQECGDPTKQRQEPQRVFGSANGQDHCLLDQEKAWRGDLGVVEREEQRRDRAIDDVAREGSLVDPERGVADVLPHAQDHPDDDEGDGCNEKRRALWARRWTKRLADARCQTSASR